jgi:hypothetical protein
MHTVKTLWHWLHKFSLKDRITLMLSIVALVLSAISYLSSVRSAEDVASSSAISTEYDLFKDLMRIEVEHPAVSHLFAQTSVSYETLAGQVARASGGADQHTRSKLLLKERGVADFIFTSYEETCSTQKRTATDRTAHLFLALWGSRASLGKASSVGRPAPARRKPLTGNC